MGAVGVGKSTFLSKLENVIKYLEPEPLDYWGDWLRLHLVNINNP